MADDTWDAHLGALTRLVTPDSQPNLNPINQRLKNIDAMALSLKFFGYELARTLAAALPVRTGLEPRHVGLGSKPSTQADLESDWAAYWLSQLHVPVVFHRKLWEYAYVLQALWERGQLREGARGLGFGCGQEPLPSYLAACGVTVTVTDLSPEQSEGRGWASSNQYTATIEHAFKRHLVTRERFDANVTLAYVDMNAIPEGLSGFDFCWSICALEHLGSIRQGLDFVRNALSTLRPGGVAVHTTEFNFSNDTETLDNWATVLFQRQHFQALAAELTAAGHTVAPLDFHVGSKPLDKFIDLPPWDNELIKEWSGSAAHLKLAIDGFPSTCFGVIVTKG